MSTAQPLRLFSCLLLLFLFSCIEKINAQTSWGATFEKEGEIYGIQFNLSASNDPQKLIFQGFEIIKYDSEANGMVTIYRSENAQTVLAEGQFRFSDQDVPIDNTYKGFSLLLNLPAYNNELTGVLDIPALNISDKNLQFSSEDMMEQMWKFINDGRQQKEALATVTEWKGIRFPDVFWKGGLLTLLVATVLVFFIQRFRYRFLHDRKQLNLPVPDKGTAQRLPYPIIRLAIIKSWKVKKRILLLTPEGITVAAVPDDESLETLYNISWEGHWKNAVFLNKKQSFAFADISSLSVSRNVVNRELKFVLRCGGKQIIFYMPEKEADLCQQVFTAALGNRYQAILFREPVKQLAVFLSLWMLSFAIALLEGSSGEGRLISFYIFLLLFLLAHITSTLIAWMQSYFYEQRVLQPIRLPFLNTSRLRWLGMVCKLLAAMIILSWTPGYLDEHLRVLDKPLLPIPDWMLKPYDMLNVKDGLVTFAIAGNLACFAYFLMPPRFSSPANKSLSILYLYSAADYGAHSLNGKGGRWAKWMGIQNPFPSLKKKEPGSIAYLVSLLSMRYLYHFHPIRIIRIIVGRPQDTTREQLCTYVASLGHLHTPIASQEYLFKSQSPVDNNNWLSELEKERYTHAIVQPYYREAGYAPGLEKLIQQMPASKVLINLIHFQANPEAYELFRMQLMQWLPSCQVPQHLGISRKVYFMSFHDDGKPCLFPVKQYKGLSSFFKNTSVDMGATLSSFFSK